VAAAWHHAITADDFLELASPSDVVLTPDGRVVAFVAGKAYDEPEKRSPRIIASA
jgi:hypothetical protein